MSLYLCFHDNNIQHTHPVFFSVELSLKGFTEWKIHCTLFSKEPKNIFFLLSNIFLVFPPWHRKQLFIISRHATWCLLFACRVLFVCEINFPNFLIAKDKTSVSFNHFHSSRCKWYVICQTYAVKVKRYCCT